VASRDVLDELSVTRANILRLLKLEGFVSIPRIAEALGMSHEAARKQVGDLHKGGWIKSNCEPDPSERGGPAPGRPPAMYCLTAAGDHFFPKQYASLTIGLLDTIAVDGDESLTEALARMTDARVSWLEPHIATLPLEKKMEQLRAIYRAGDPFTDVERRGVDFVLTERNCPYLTVAMERPDICGTTVSTLRRLTGCEVVRERRFQDGDGRCEFHVRTAAASPENEKVRFEREPARTS
jgi:predicted ArsR family transcriptional regulator